MPLLTKAKVSVCTLNLQILIRVYVGFEGVHGVCAGILGVGFYLRVLEDTFDSLPTLPIPWMHKHKAWHTFQIVKETNDNWKSDTAWSLYTVFTWFY